MVGIELMTNTIIEIVVGNIKPVICSVVNFMRNEGIEKISLVGFAW